MLAYNQNLKFTLCIYCGDLKLGINTYLIMVKLLELKLDEMFSSIKGPFLVCKAAMKDVIFEDLNLQSTTI